MVANLAWEDEDVSTNVLLWGLIIREATDVMRGVSVCAWGCVYWALQPMTYYVSGFTNTARSVDAQPRTNSPLFIIINISMRFHLTNARTWV